jgi:HK97 family phage prohead protease
MYSTTATGQKAFTLDVPTAVSTIQTERGDLIVKGLAASFDGLDRHGEQFIRGAFRDSIQRFLTQPAGAPLCWHHRKGMAIGQVLELNETDNGLEFKALVAKQEPSSPLYYIWDGIRRGIYKGVSVGGFFKRKLTEGGWRIAQADLTEISITPVPIYTGTFAYATEVKALQDFCDAGIMPDVDSIAAELNDLERRMLLYEARELQHKLRALQL